MAQNNLISPSHTHRASFGSRVARKTLSSENLLYLLAVLKQFWLKTKIYMHMQLGDIQCVQILWFTQTADLFLKNVFSWHPLYLLCSSKNWRSIQKKCWGWRPFHLTRPLTQARVETRKSQKDHCVLCLGLLMPKVCTLVFFVWSKPWLAGDIYFTVITMSQYSLYIT
jgi:hypothetical protein